MAHIRGFGITRHMKKILFLPESGLRPKPGVGARRRWRWRKPSLPGPSQSLRARVFELEVEHEALLGQQPFLVHNPLSKDILLLGPLFD